MSSIKRFAGACLHVPGRLYDLLAIVLISTGINVMTGAGGREHEILAFASGFAFVAAGVFSAFMKRRADLILRAVESSAAVKAEEIASKLTANARKNPPAGPVADEAAPADAKKEKKHSSPVDAVVHAHLENAPREAAIVIAQCGLLLFLMALGTFGTFWGLYADENRDLSKIVESSAEDVQEKVQAEGEHLANDLAALSGLSSSNHTLVVDHTTARCQDVTSHLVSLRADIAALSALISNSTNGAGADSEAREDAAEE